MNAIDHAAMSHTMRLQQFQARRRKDLLASGLRPEAAARFAKVETQARARAAMVFGIEQALSAKLEYIDQSDPDKPLFRLVYIPSE